jgi:hypothetical protein
MKDSGEIAIIAKIAVIAKIENQQSRSALLNSGDYGSFGNPGNS